MPSTPLASGLGYPWTRTTIRKSHHCRRCRTTIPPHTDTYRPITNTRARAWRFCLTCADATLEPALAAPHDDPPDPRTP